MPKKNIRPHIKAKHETIRKEYDKLYKQGYQHKKVCEMLAKKYFHTTETIESIVWKKGSYLEKKADDNDNQLTLF